MTGNLFCFGYGFCAAAVSSLLQERGWQVSGTRRTSGRTAESGVPNTGIIDFYNKTAVALAVERASHILVSVPPHRENGDLVLAHYEKIIGKNPGLKWIGYLSTTGVYGNRQGGLVDETTEPRPSAQRSVRRLDAEKSWTLFSEKTGIPVHIFRLAGIYGPGRNALRTVAQGTARRIIKEGQKFSRIHVSDVARVLDVAMTQYEPVCRIYNVCDNEAAPPQDVVTFAARLLKCAPPPEIPFEKAGLSPMGASFYQDNRLVSNARMRCDLGVEPLYPTYREGLQALFEDGAY